MTRQGGLVPFRLRRLLRLIRRAPRRARGFTLVEMLVTVLIFGVLIALAYPSYAEYVERSKRSKAISEIGTIQLAIMRYESGKGELPNALTDIYPAGFKDPWGNPYVYTDLSEKGAKGQARKDHKLNPINSDFDLFSAGKNGIWKTQISQKDSLDDIIRARDGAFIGLASDFTN